MTGAGFGGCAVAIMDAEKANDFVEKTAAAYQRRTGLVPLLYVCHATNGAEVLS
jgi:galactokinase